MSRLLWKPTEKCMWTDKHLFYNVSISRNPWVNMYELHSDMPRDARLYTGRWCCGDCIFIRLSYVAILYKTYMNSNGYIQGYES